MNISILFITLFLTATTACWFDKSKSKSPDGTVGNTLPILDTSYGVIITRSTSRSAVEIKFATLRQASCTIHYWSQSDREPFTQAKPGIHRCEAGDADSIFAENLDSFEPEDIYFFHLEIQAPGKKERLLIREEKDGITVFRPNPGGPVLGQNLVLAKVDIPTGVIGISGLASSETLDLPSVNSTLTRQSGCYTNPSPKVLTPLESSSFTQTNPGISSLTTRGFATGEAIPWKNQPGMQRIEVIDKFQWGNAWEWIYEKRGIEESFQTSSAPVVRSFGISKPIPVSISGSGIEGKPQKFDLSKSNSIEFEWEILGSGPHSYVTTSLISLSKEKFLYCIFPTRSGKGLINSNDLNLLGTGEFDLVIMLEDFRIHGYQVKSKHGWVIKVMDWRHATLSL